MLSALVVLFAVAGDVDIPSRPANIAADKTPFTGGAGGINKAHVYLLTSTGSKNLTGISAPAKDGWTVSICNVGTGTIVVKNAGNVVNFGGADVSLFTSTKAPACWNGAWNASKAKWAQASSSLLDQDPRFQYGINKAFDASGERDGLWLDFTGYNGASTPANALFYLQSGGQSGFFFGSDISHNGSNNRHMARIYYSESAQKLVITSGDQSFADGTGQGISITPGHKEPLQLWSGSGGQHVDIVEDGASVAEMRTGGVVVLLQDTRNFGGGSVPVVIGGGGSVTAQVLAGSGCLCGTEVAADYTGCAVIGTTLTITGTPGAKSTYLCSKATP